MVNKNILILDHKINILVATNHLDKIGGTETFTYTLIEELQKRKNIDVEYFTFRKGLVSDKVEQDLKIKFLSKKKYDLILANHNSTVAKLYKKGFVIQTCHGIYPKLEQPSPYAQAFVSISQEVQNHLASKAKASKIILNGINLKRYFPKKKVNNKLVSVLSLCQSDEANSFIQKCCDSIQVEVKFANKFKSSIWKIEDLINEADLVIGLGRSAYEAMACGRTVIVYDNRPYFDSMGDGYVKEILGLSLQNNCSGRYTQTNFDEKSFINELKKYNSLDGEYFRKFAEKELNIEKNVDSYLEYWQQIVKYNKKTKTKKIQKIIGKKGYAFAAKINHKLF